LIVEDDPAIRETVAELFELNSFKVGTVANGALAYRKILDRKPDIVISDIMMPVMDGLQLLRRIRSNPETQLIPFILITAKAMTESKLECLEQGADDYLTKPFEIKELFLKVRNLTDRRDKMIKSFASTPDSIQKNSKEEDFSYTLKRHLEEQLSNSNLSLEDIARALGVSTSTLQKKIKQKFNKSVSQFIREFRLKRAHDLIVLSNCSLKEIAFKTGFNSLSYFSISYKKFYGISPSEHY